MRVRPIWMDRDRCDYPPHWMPSYAVPLALAIGLITTIVIAAIVIAVIVFWECVQ